MRTVFLLSVALLLSACQYAPVPLDTGWFPDSFHSNGERIYFTATNDEGQRIRYSGGPRIGGMMGRYLTCASCHGPDARGGLHMMHMRVMDAPDIRWSALAVEGAHEEEGEGHGGYDLDTFREAVVEGRHPDGTVMDRDMPRWDIEDQDLSELAAYLRSLP